jgi:hypothetical protein
MEWYEIMGIIIFWFVGLWLKGKFYEQLRGRGYNGSWRSSWKRLKDAEVSFIL